MSVEPRGTRMDLEDDLNAIEAMLSQSYSPSGCVRCGRHCRTTLGVEIQHPDFYATLPLVVCEVCSSESPFHANSLSGPRKALLKIINAVRNWFQSRTSKKNVDASEASELLRSIFQSVPVYRTLLQHYPQLSLRCVPHQVLRFYSGNDEAVRFRYGFHKREVATWYFNQEQWTKGGMPEHLAGAYAEIIRREIRAAVEQSLVAYPLIVQVSFVLLPQRRIEFDVHVLSEMNTSEKEIENELVRRLRAIPCWPVAYPLTISIQKIFGIPPETLFQALPFPFEFWRTRVNDAETTFSEAAIKYYDITLPDAPVGFTAEDCETMYRLLPDSIPLKCLLAEVLTLSDRISEAIDQYDELIEQVPEEELFVANRLQCLAKLGQLERAAADCRAWIERKPESAVRHRAMANLLLDLNQPDASLFEINAALKLGETADRFRMRGMVLATLGRHEEALSDANVAIFLDRNLADAYYLKLQLLRIFSRFDEALSDLDQVERCLGRTIAIVLLRTDILFDQGRVTDAEQTLKDCLLENPDHPTILKRWVTLLVSTGKLESASRECDRMLEIDPESGEAYSLRARIAFEMGDYALSLQASEESIKRMGPTPQVLAARGLAKAAQDDLEGGLTEFDNCIEQFPDFVFSRFHRARLHRQLEQYESAIDDYTATLDVVPQFVDAFVERGFVWLQLEMQQNARDDFERAIEIAPSRADAYSGRAITFLMDSKKSAAEEDLNKAVALDPTDKMGRLNRAQLLMERSDFDLATEDLSQILADDPNERLALWQTAQLNLMTGQLSEAVNCFNRLLEMDPEAPQILIGRSATFELMGEAEKAEADRNEALNLSSSSPEELKRAQLLLTASAAFASNQFEKAIELATEVIESQDEPNWRAWRLRAQARWYNEEFVEALDDYNVILQEDEERTRADDSAYGQVLCEIGEFEQALTTLDRSIELARHDEDTLGLAFSLNGRGRALAGLNRFEDAEQAFAESIQLKPDNAWLHFNRGLMYLTQSDQTRARECFEQSLKVTSPRLTPAKRRRALGFIQTMRDSGSPTC